MSYIEYVNARPHGEELKANLADALGYDPAELADNRAGKMSRAQVRRLVVGEIASPIVYASLSLMASLAIRFIYLNYAKGMDLGQAFQATIGNLFLLRFSTAMENLFDNSGPSGTGFTLASYGVLFVAVLKLVKLPWRTVADVAGGRVSKVTGRVDVRLEERMVKVERGKKEQIPVHFLAVKEHKFEVAKPVVEALREGLPYDVYYAPNSRHLIALEPRQQEDTPAAQPAAPESHQTPAVS